MAARYWAWINRDRPAKATRIGIWVALAGALVGALLGFNATSGLIAVITAIVGAAAGANLGLIALDVAQIGEPPETGITRPGLHHPGEGVASDEPALADGSRAPLVRCLSL